MAHDVFISYASGDKPVAETVCAILERRQVRCWIAPRDIVPGQEYGEAIVDAIAESKALVLVFSSRSNASPQVEREIERAAAKHVNIIPFRIEDVKPSKRLEYFISSCQWCDAFVGKLETHVQALAAVIDGQVPSLPDPTPTPRRVYLAAGVGMLIALLLALVLYFRPVSPPVVRIEGDWRADVTYDWGATYPETFKFKLDGDDVLGTASFGGVPRGILNGKLIGGKLTFATRTQEVTDGRDDAEGLLHRYRGIVSDERIQFYMQTAGGVSDHSQIEFLARRPLAQAAAR